MTFGMKPAPARWEANGGYPKEAKVPPACNLVASKRACNPLAAAPIAELRENCESERRSLQSLNLRPPGPSARRSACNAKLLVN